MNGYNTNSHNQFSIINKSVIFCIHYVVPIPRLSYIVLITKIFLSVFYINNVKKARKR